MNRIARDEGPEAMQAEIRRRLGLPEGYEPKDEMGESEVRPE